MKSDASEEVKKSPPSQRLTEQAAILTEKARLTASSGQPILSANLIVATHLLRESAQLAKAVEEGWMPVTFEEAQKLVDLYLKQYPQIGADLNYVHNAIFTLFDGERPAFEGLLKYGASAKAHVSDQERRTYLNILSRLQKSPGDTRKCPDCGTVWLQDGTIKSAVPTPCVTCEESLYKPNKTLRTVWFSQPYSGEPPTGTATKCVWEEEIIFGCKDCGRFPSWYEGVEEDISPAGKKYKLKCVTCHRVVFSDDKKTAIFAWNKMNQAEDCNACSHCNSIYGLQSKKFIRLCNPTCDGCSKLLDPKHEPMPEAPWPESPADAMDVWPLAPEELGARKCYKCRIIPSFYSAGKAFSIRCSGCKDRLNSVPFDPDFASKESLVKHWNAKQEKNELEIKTRYNFVLRGCTCGSLWNQDGLNHRNYTGKSRCETCTSRFSSISAFTAHSTETHWKLKFRLGSVPSGDYQYKIPNCTCESLWQKNGLYFRSFEYPILNQIGVTPEGVEICQACRSRNSAIFAKINDVNLAPCDWADQFTFEDKAAPAVMPIKVDCLALPANGRTEKPTARGTYDKMAEKVILETLLSSAAGENRPPNISDKLWAEISRKPDIRMTDTKVRILPFYYGAQPWNAILNNLDLNFAYVVQQDCSDGEEIKIDLKIHRLELQSEQDLVATSKEKMRRDLFGDEDAEIKPLNKVRVSGIGTHKDVPTWIGTLIVADSDKALVKDSSGAEITVSLKTHKIENMVNLPARDSSATEKEPGEEIDEPLLPLQDCPRCLAQGRKPGIEFFWLLRPNFDKDDIILEGALVRCMGCGSRPDGLTASFTVIGIAPHRNMAAKAWNKAVELWKDRNQQ